MSQIPPTPRRDPPEDPWGEGGPPERDGPPASGSKRLIVFVAVAVGLIGLVVWLMDRYPSALDSESAMINLVRMGAILVLVASGILASRRLNLSKAVRDLAIWAAIVAGLVAVYGFRSELETVGRRIIGEMEPSRGQEVAGGAMEYRRDADGHFYVDAEVNGKPVRFLVDTGASEIVLSPQDAERLGFRRSMLKFDRQYETANGLVLGAAVTLRKMQAGDIRFYDIPASVNGAPMSESLLGMTFLDRLAGFEVTGDSLILRP